MLINVWQSKLILAAAVLGSFALCAQPSLARGSSADTRTSANTTNHLSAQGMDSTNGRYAADRDTGLDRAEDRMSAQGRAHSHALKHHPSDNDADDKPATTPSGTRH